MPDYDWNSPNIGSAIGISVGAGLATAVGGALAFCPSVLKSVPPNKILAVALALQRVCARVLCTDRISRAL